MKIGKRNMWDKKKKTTEGWFVLTHYSADNTAHSAIVPNILTAYFLDRGQSYGLNRRPLCFFWARGTVRRFISRTRSHGSRSNRKRETGIPIKMREFECARARARGAVVKMMSHGGFVASPPVKYTEVGL